MSADTPAGLAVAAFGDPERGLWGVALGDGSPAVVWGQIGDSSAPVIETGAVEDSDDGWIVKSPSASLQISPRSEIAAASRGGERPLELCRAVGRLGRDGQHDGTDLAAVRAELPGGHLDSIRLVAAWLPSGNDLGLVASRPRGASGQDRDEIVVSVLGEKEGVSVFEPRLSTTYNGQGEPRRMGIELWLGETEDGEQYPRRAAGEAAGAPARSAQPPFEVTPLRCHSRDEDGIGIYLVLRPQ